MFIDFSPEKSLTLKQKLWKALKPGTNHLYTTNIHGRGAQTRATFLLKGSVAGAGQCLPSTSCPVWPPWAVPCRACDPQTHTRQQLEGHEHTLPAGQRRRVVSVTATSWSVSSWEHARDLANGSLQADPWMHWGPGWGLHTMFGLQDWATRESAAPLRDFGVFFFNATSQSFLLIWENRCHVWFLLSLVAMTPLDHVLSYVKNIKYFML